MKTLLALAALSLWNPSLAPRGTGIDWEPTYDEGLALSAAEGRVTFIAVNMDGERANDRMAKDVYQDKRIRELSTSTVNLVASNFTHSKKGTCPRFGDITCEEHRRIDVDVRAKVLEPDKQGFVVAPQHVWLGPLGEVLLSVPYGISSDEMEWCFVTALRAVDPDFEWELSGKARAPKRLVMGGVAPTAEVGKAGSAPPTRKQALELLEQLQRGARGEKARKMVRRLAQADEPEARDYMVTYLRASAGGGRRGGGPKEGEPDRRAVLLRWIGAASPTSYWEVCAEFISAGEETLRAEAVVALEQLAAPDSLKLLRSAVKKEKDPRIRKNLLRAVGAAGGEDKQARKLLLKQAGDKRNELWKRNAILALGYLAPHEDVHEFLTDLLADTDAPTEEREAAVLAMALTRDKSWLELLGKVAHDIEQVAQEQKQEQGLKEVLLSAIEVLKGGPLQAIRADLERIGEDEIPRERQFAAQSAGRSRGEKTNG